MTAMLASVASLAEAQIAFEEGVDLIDLKNPRAGVLGALDRDEIQRIVTALAGVRPISATIGDVPMDPDSVRSATATIAACGVDYVKVGLPTAGDRRACVRACASIGRQSKLVGVLFADQAMDWEMLSVLAEHGFRGAMLDTAAKESGSLHTFWDQERLAAFVGRCRQLGLYCGLAGSLHIEDVTTLLPLAPDYLGFRGALCAAGRRGAGLQRAAVRAVRQRIPIHANSHAATG